MQSVPQEVETNSPLDALSSLFPGGFLRQQWPLSGNPRLEVGSGPQVCNSDLFSAAKVLTLGSWEVSAGSWTPFGSQRGWRGRRAPVFAVSRPLCRVWDGRRAHLQTQIRARLRY